LEARNFYEILASVRGSSEGQKLRKNLASGPTFVRFGPKADKRGRNWLVRFVPILLQKSQIAERQFSRQKTRQDVIAD
jgi:hypothetical protein